MAGIIYQTDHCWGWLSSPNASNWALAIVGMAGVIAAVWTLCIIRRQTKATETAANAAKDNADALIKSERAWVIVTVDLIGNHQKSKGGIVRFGFGFNWYVKNCGKTPAFITKIGARFHTVKVISELPEEPNIDVPDLVQATDYFPHGFGVGPNESIERYTFSKEKRPTDAQEYSEACAGRPIWIAYGVVEYRLIFEMEKLRETHFCYVWMPGKEDSFVCSSIPRQYTKQT